MSKRRNQDAVFNSRVALKALKGERTVSELAAAAHHLYDHATPKIRDGYIGPIKKLGL